METVPGLHGIVEDIKKSLDSKESIREEVLRVTRRLIQHSRRIIGSVHQKKDTTDLWKDAEAELEHLAHLLEKEPQLRFTGYVESAHQEYCEAHILLSINSGSELSTPQQIGVTNSAYLLGLGDTVGELRRLAVDALREGDVDTADRHLESMNTIFDEINQFVYPSALVNIRPKRDVARSLLEKTRGEIAIAKTASNIAKFTQ